VAIPNKTVAELIVYNRTRSLAAAAAATAAATETAGTAAAAIAAVAVPVVAAPLRRVLCFSIQLGRECDQRLDEVRGDVKALLNRITMKELVDAGVAAYSPAQLQELAADDATADAAPAGADGDAAAADITVDVATADAVVVRKAGGAAIAASEAVPAGVATMQDTAKEQVDQQQQQQQEEDVEAEQSPVDGVMKAVLAGITGVDTVDAAGAASPAEQQLPDVEPLPVSISLAKLAEDNMRLFVRCELMLPGSTAEEAVEQQTEEVLIGVSSLVREKYQGIVLWC
jgi:hypothetical protein